MKKIILLTLTICFVAALFAQVPNGTYLPCNDITKSMYIEKVVFNNANKVIIYLGTMGMTMGFEELKYEIQEMDKKLPFVQVYFEYDKTNDILVFGEAYTNSMLDMLSQMGNSVKLMYNKSGNCNPNLVSTNKIRILVKDNNQDVSAEILNNYLIVSDNKNILPRLDKVSAIKSGKYTDAQIATATKILHDVMNNYLKGLQNKIVAANTILSYIEDNSVAIVDGIAEIYTYFSPVPSLSTPDYLQEFGVLGDLFFEWTKKVVLSSMPSVGDILGPDLSKNVKSITTTLPVFSKLIKSLIDENDRINK
ncbi:hypothetical protein FACS189437_02530 [Bacteroidia bacterium]|nr:hypothetical protein FACS189437_02530 [Bacteroidia bacterium]